MGCSLVECLIFVYNVVAMKNLLFIEPKTDDFLKWNEETKMYELTLQYVKSELDIHFANDSITEKRIKKNSRKIYNFIKHRAYSGNVRYIDRLLNGTNEGREFLKKVLLEQLDADNETGFNDLSNQPAIDIASGREINRDSLYLNQISVDTEQLIDENAQYFGFNIMLRGSYPPLIQMYLNSKGKGKYYS